MHFSYAGYFSQNEKRRKSDRARNWKIMTVSGVFWIFFLKISIFVAFLVALESAFVRP